MSILNIVISLLLAFLAFRILIMNGLNMNFMAVILAVLTIGAMIAECALNPNGTNFLNKVLLLIGGFFLIFIGLNVVLPKSSLSLDTLMYYRYFIFVEIAGFAIDLIGFFTLSDDEPASNTGKDIDEQAKLAKLKYQQNLKQQQKKQKEIKKQRKMRKRSKRVRKTNKRRTNNKVASQSSLQAKINADRQAQQRNNMSTQPINNNQSLNNNDDEIL